MQEYAIVQRVNEGAKRCECGNYASYRVVRLDAALPDGTWPWSGLSCGECIDARIWAAFLASRRFSTTPTWESVS